MSQPTAPVQRRDLLLRQEAYASAVDPRDSRLAYSSLDFNFVCSAPMTSRKSLTIGAQLNFLFCL
jgi:hypothetical protein